MLFENYLQDKKLASSTIERYRSYLSHFEMYLQNEGLSFEKLTYTDLLVFIEHRRKQKHSQPYINAQLAAIRYYLDFLVEQQVLPCQVAGELFIRGRRKTLPSALLSSEELQALYENYEVKNVCSLRRKVVLGLMVFQGLLPDEMQKLRIKDVKLEQAKIEVSASRRSQSRVLDLVASQMFYLQQYLQQVEGEFLFSLRIPQLLEKFLKSLKVRSASQLKQSRLTQMLKTRDLREVQTFAGHRFVSSTERYETTPLQTLENELSKFHPLN
jgi:integrase/recombinase XerD